MKKKVYKNLLDRDDVHPLIIDFILLDVYGTEYYFWEPETIWIELYKELDVVATSSLRNKLQAVKTCRLSDTAYKKWEAFEKIGISLCGDIPSFGVIQVLSPFDCIKSYDILKKLNIFEFDEEIYKYIAASMLSEHFYYAPKLIDQCNIYLLKFTGEKFHSDVKKLYDVKNIDKNNESLSIQVANTLALEEYAEINNKLAKIQFEYLKNEVK